MDFSAAALIASFAVSTLGFGFFIYGKKQARVPQLVGGLVMMLGPYLVGSALATWLLGVVATLGVWVAVHVGW